MELYPGVSHERMLALARRLVGAQDAEDVVQTAYLKAYAARRSFREASRAETWVYRIVQRCAIDLGRQRQRRPEEGLPEELSQRGSEWDLDVDDALRRLGALNARDRETLAAAMEHETRAGAAAALGITVRAYDNRLRRAKRRAQEQS